MTLHPEVQALSDIMHELERILRDQGQTHWLITLRDVSAP